RLGLADRIHELIDPNISLHAVGQGALGIECREADPQVLALIKVLEHRPTSLRCLAERSFLRSLEGGCQVPIGVNSSFDSADNLVLTGMVASLDGKRLIRDQVQGSQADPEAIGIALAEKLRSRGAGEILQQIFADVRPQS
ncbi:MAG: hydroxymethylbilane synthase, partial [Synechococcaceae bacterium WBB_34_004]|nr:hydroxymethylbilane synthase [Synechococcaceae bacterium WBB_34_004]